MSFGLDNMTPEGRKYFDELEKLSKMEVDVGFQEGVPHKDDPATVAEIAAYNDLGTSRIPARPFMEQSMDRRDELHEACAQAKNKVVNGGTAEEALEGLGVYAVGLIQRQIRNGDYAPNAPATIARKRNGDTPLINYGTMIQNVNYVVKERSD